MNKYKLSLGLAILIFLSSTQGVMALSFGTATNKNKPTSTNQVNYQKVTQEAKDTMLEEREKIRQEIKSGSLEVMQKVGALHATSLETRYSFYYTRLKNIYDRLNTRLTDLEGQYGTDRLSKARSLWKQAGAKLDEAQRKGSTVITDFRTVNGKDLKTQRQKVFATRDQSKIVLALYKEATQLMKDSVKEIRLVTANSPRPSAVAKPKPSPRVKKMTTPVSVVPPATTN